MLLLLLSCFDGDNLLTIIGDVVVVFKSFFSASVLPILLHVAARRASGDALLSVACKHKKIYIYYFICLNNVFVAIADIHRSVKTTNKK